jgi:hypothetical protein
LRRTLRSAKAEAEISSRAEALKARVQEARARVSEEGMSYAQAVTNGLRTQNRIDVRGLQLKLSAVEISERLSSTQLADSASAFAALQKDCQQAASAKTAADSRVAGQQRDLKTRQIETRGHSLKLGIAEAYRQIDQDAIHSQRAEMVRRDGQHRVAARGKDLKLALADAYRNVDRNALESQGTENATTLGGLQARYGQQSIEGRGLALQLAATNMSAHLATLELAGRGSEDDLATLLQQAESQRVVTHQFRRLFIGEISRPNGSLGSLALHMRVCACHTHAFANV